MPAALLIHVASEVKDFRSWRKLIAYFGIQIGSRNVFSRRDCGRGLTLLHS